MKIIKRVYAYIRVSTGEQVDNYSLETQEEAIRRYCDQRGYELVYVFREEGESAKTANRTALKELRKKCQTAKKDDIQGVVIFKIDRLSRNVQDFFDITADFYANGLTLLSPNQTFELNATGKMTTNIAAVFAQFDNDQRAERAVDGMRAGIAKGHWQWKVPVGYEKPLSDVGPSLVPDDYVAPLILQGFQKVARGEVKSKVLEELNQLGLKTKNGKPMSKQSFNLLLKNQVYVGRIVSKKLEMDCPGDFEALVPIRVFEAVQLSFNGKYSANAKKKLDNPELPFKRWANCGVCSTPLTGSFSKGNGGTYGYYFCRNDKCRAVKVKKEVIETQFIEFLEKKSVAHEILNLFEAVVLDMWKESNKEKIATAKTIDTKIEAIEISQGKLLDLYIAGKGITEEIYSERNSKYLEEISKLEVAKSQNLDFDIDVNEVLQFSKLLFSDLKGCWNRIESQDKPRFLRSMAPNGVTYSNNGFGTIQSSWFIPGLVTSTSTNDACPPLTGVEPLINWLFSRLEQLQDEATDLRSLRHEEVHELQHEHAVDRGA